MHSIGFSEHAAVTSAFCELYTAFIQLPWRQLVVSGNDAAFPLVALIMESRKRELGCGAEKVDCSVAMLPVGDWASIIRHVLTDALLWLTDVELGFNAGMILHKMFARLLSFAPRWALRNIACCCIIPR